MATGYLLYHGPSAFTGQSIVGVMTGVERITKNEKTGPMLQAWILAADEPPATAALSGLDEANCGTCPLRTTMLVNARGKLVQSRKCYVLPFQAPQNVYRKWRKGHYPRMTAAAWRMLADRTLRLGAYGEPTALPYRLVRRLALGARGITGYTHQWATCDQRFKGLLMASVESLEDYQQAKAAGWRTFRVRRPGSALLGGEIACPADPAVAIRTTCHDCLLCDGSHPYVSRGQIAPDPRATIAITAHGQQTRRF